jgi:hypothetical protein
VTIDVDASSELGVRNSQPEGIGRVACLGDLVAWNNLGRNIVFADRHLRPLAVFGSTRYGDDDELSQYDLDIHALLAVPGRNLVLALNHLGLLRLFLRSHLAGVGLPHEVHPVVTALAPADMERSIVAGSRLVGSRPRAEGAIGLVVSQPLETAVDDAPLGAHVVGEDLGEVTALGSVGGADGPLVVVGGPGQVGLVSVSGATVGTPRWQVDVSFRAAVVEWDGRLVWVAGPATTAVVDDYNWDLLRGGGFVALDPGDGSVVTSGSLPDDVAWGTGGVAVVRAGAVLCAVGRAGAVHTLDLTTSSTWRSTPARAAGSLGIAHAAVAGHTVVYGFNRGGYRLWASLADSPGSVPA